MLLANLFYSAVLFGGYELLSLPVAGAASVGMVASVTESRSNGSIAAIVLSWSGGKDSCLALYKALAARRTTRLPGDDVHRGRSAFAVAWAAGEVLRLRRRRSACRC